MPRSLSLSTPPHFDLPLVATSHGWYDLPPFHWDPKQRRLSTVMELDGISQKVELRQARRGAAVSARINDTSASLSLRAAARRVLQLDLDLTEFWQHCERDPELRWVARHGAGRLLRAPTLFEDLMKILLTTNCSWAMTRHMTQRLVTELGEPTAEGERAFPTAERCAEKDERYFSEVIRAGYRAKAMARLAKAVAAHPDLEAELDPRKVSIPEIRQRLSLLDGFGPYAVGQAMRLLGAFEDLALDSWCRAKWARMKGRRRPPRDTTIARRVQRFRPYQGLALWMLLTADWHQESHAAHG